MSLSELWRCIFVAWVVAVGWFRGVMLHKQNDEGPSSSHNFGPASTDSANSQHNTIQADEADDSNFYQTPIVGVVQSNIQQDKANLQYNALQANSAKKSNFYQMPIAGKVTHGTQPNMQQDMANLQAQLCYGILIALIAVGLFWRGMLRQQNNEGPSSSHNFGPASTDSANSQHNAIQANEAVDSNFYQIPTVGEVPPNIQQDKANLQYNVIQANSAKKSNFYQIPRAGNVTQRTQPNIQQAKEN